jgi:NadR type nicotinamide-nucleotide adenylyltransferase
MNFGFGVVIGKFYPPHRGHSYLIDTALDGCEHLIVIVCGRPADTIPGSVRGEWLKELHPSAEVMVIDDRYDENDSRIWAENTIGWLGRAPDVVFTSEDYGDRYAALMGAQHICVDKPRNTVPISGTALRNDPFTHWDFIDPPVRGWFAKRVCILGAESTGTTTLAKALAKKLHTVWVPEFGREYSELKLERNDPAWRSEEFETIAEEQNRRENIAARSANRILICDTNSFATRLWHRRYIGFESPKVKQISQNVQCDLFILTGDEIPFVQDGLRDGEHIRHEMHRWFEDELAQHCVPWHVLRGAHSERLNAAIELIRRAFNQSTWKPFALHDSARGRQAEQKIVPEV